MLSDLNLLYSGGTGNSDPALSLGGTKGNSISHQTVTWTNTSFGGITLTESDGFVSNYNLLVLSDGSITLHDPITGFHGNYVIPDIDGDYYLTASDIGNQPYSWLKITVVKATFDTAVGNISGGLAYRGLTFTQAIAQLLPSINATQSENGQTIYRCFMLHNNTSDTLNINLFTDNKNSPANVKIGLDPVAVGTDPIAATSDGTTPPAGVTFSEPDTDNKLTIPELLINEMQPVWFEFSIAAFNLLSAEPAFFKLNHEVVVG